MGTLSGSKNIAPWNNWYHVTVHVYGSWLRGDPRGWRARHHREHVDGDYKHPSPKGKYDNLYELSKALMKRDPVRIATELRQFIANAVAEKPRWTWRPESVSSNGCPSPPISTYSSSMSPSRGQSAC